MPILSRISMIAIAVGACAMIILFSVFNGFEHLIKDLYKAFYPDIKITAVKGKFFHLSNEQFQKIKNIPGILYTSRVIEDNVWLNANDEDGIATLKGVDTFYEHVNGLRDYIFEGTDKIVDSPIANAIVGLHIANKLGLQPNNVFSRLQIFYPNPTVENPVLNPAAALQSIQLKTDGVFQVQDEFDSKYVIASLPVVQSLFLQDGNYSSIEIALDKKTNPGNIQSLLENILGTQYNIATRFEQNKTLYMVMQSEKWAVYGILLLVLIIASFNMVGALTLLVLEKKKDIAILKAMGATPSSIRKIFITEGILWALIGGGIGLAIGFLLCWGQLHFQWIKLQGAFVISAYPVLIKTTDVILILITIVIIGLLASWYPAKKATSVEDISLKAT